VSVLELAAVRPDDWNFPLFLHVLSAMVLVGAVVLSLTALAGASRGGSVATVRLGYRSLLVVAIPAWIVMRLTAQWLLDKENLEDLELQWVDIGFVVTEPGLLLLLGGTLLAGLAARAVGRGEGPASGRIRAATILTALLLVAYLVAIWAMTTKPI
jgi:hypothetical protein